MKGGQPRSTTSVILEALCDHLLEKPTLYIDEMAIILWDEFAVRQTMRHCVKWLEPKSVLVMDNASFHHSDRVEQMCSEGGVRLLYLPLYSPDLNPIEESFAELKAFIRRHWHFYEEYPAEGFDNFLEWCLDTVSARSASAEGHSRL